jgi:hypothetical protein
MKGVAVSENIPEYFPEACPRGSAGNPPGRSLCLRQDIETAHIYPEKIARDAIG